jgi:cytochrome c
MRLTYIGLTVGLLLAPGLLACSGDPVVPPPVVMGDEDASTTPGPVDAGMELRPDAMVMPPRSGAEIYAAECAVCHGPAGLGASGPSLVARVPALSDVRIGEIVIGGLGMMPPKDLSGRELVSLIKYLRDTFGMQTVTPTVAPPRDGPAIYAAECAQCHGPAGMGSMRGPPLAPRMALLMDDAVRRTITMGTGNMPARSVAEPELTTLMTYLRATFGAYMPPVAGMQGQMLYMAQCERCHGADGAGGMRGPGIRDRVLHLSQAMLGNTITQGSGNMRGRSVAPVDLPILVTYLHDTLGRYAHGAADVPFDAAGGDAVYREACASCHGADGRGATAGAIDLRVPALSNALLVRAITGMPHTTPLAEPRLSPLVAYLRMTFGAYAPPMMGFPRDGGMGMGDGGMNPGPSDGSMNPGPADGGLAPDAQPSAPDAAAPSTDAAVDAGVSPDGGAPRPDATDAGVSPDGGAPRPDAGPTPTDAGTPPITPRPQASCGNGAADLLEVCDGTSWASWADGPSCADFGLGAGNATCNAACYLDLSSCAGGTDTCAARGWYNDGWCDACDRLGGTVDPDCALHCGADGVCAEYYDTASGVWTCRAQGLVDPDCGTCGDSLVQGAEYCDGANLDNLGCTDYGFRGGTLACAMDCLPDLSGCTNTLCTNTCQYAGDGECDDGGPGADFSLCALGSDCMDCGAR